MSDEQLKVACPTCDTRLFFDKSKALKKVKCSSCESSFTVPLEYGSFILQKCKANDEYSETYLAVNTAKEGRLCRLRIFNEKVNENKSLCDAVKAKVEKLRHIALDEVVECYSLGEHKGALYIESAPLGVSLKGRMTKERVTRLQAYDLALKMVKALKAIADNDLVHGNLKPSCVNMDKQANLCLYDVSVSWEIASALALKDVGFNPINNIFYASPELIKERSATKQSDIYALGVILYELFTREKPFDGTANEVLEDHKNRQAESMLTRASSIPAELNSLVRSMMSKVASDRPQLEQVLSELENCRDNIERQQGEHILNEFNPKSDDTLVTMKAEDINMDLLQTSNKMTLDAAPGDQVPQASPNHEQPSGSSALNFRKLIVLVLVFVVLALLGAILLKLKGKTEPDSGRKALAYVLPVLDQNIL